jgi:hypothetical protein
MDWISIRIESRSTVVDPDVFGPPGSGNFSQRFGSGSFYHLSKNEKKNLDSYCFVTSS